MSNYQAVYDATRSKMSFFDGGTLANEIASKFDFSFYADQVKNAFEETAWAASRPSVLMAPTLTVDGDQWCALYGKDLQSGVAGFGNSPEKAMEDFDKNWASDLNSGHGKTLKVLSWVCKYCGENEKPSCHKCVREDGENVSDELVS